MATRYECKNPRTGFTIGTDFMGEADLWAALGYIIFDGGFYYAELFNPGFENK